VVANGGVVGCKGGECETIVAREGAVCVEDKEDDIWDGVWGWGGRGGTTI
jgi:hypothetical protein